MNDEQKTAICRLFIIPHSSFSIRFRVTNGTRTRDVQDHNLALYQLSYGHRDFTEFIGHLPPFQPGKNRLTLLDVSRIVERR